MKHILGPNLGKKQGWRTEEGLSCQKKITQPEKTCRRVEKDLTDLEISYELNGFTKIAKQKLKIIAANAAFNKSLESRAPLRNSNK